MDINNLSRKEALDLIKTLKTILEGNLIVSNNSRNAKIIDIENRNIDYYFPNSSKSNNLESLIGTIPSLLLNKEIFEKNQDIAEFAKKLDIFIPSPEKKKREDIIGRVVSAISEFDPARLSDINRAIRLVTKSNVNKSNKSSFFKDWENVIKDINL